MAFLLFTVGSAAQTVQPIISEYVGKASGKLTVTNNSLEPMVVLLEPRSFSLNEQGKGTVRALDAGIHVKLSTTSLRLAPKQTGYVFYEATAETLPAWFTVYSTFTSPKHGPGLDLRLVLPHTVYLYQKEPLRLQDVKVSNAHYDAETHKVEFDLQSLTSGMGRVQTVHVTGGRTDVEAASFPLMPEALRHVEIAWTGTAPPEEITLRFDKFKLSAPIEH